MSLRSSFSRLLRTQVHSVLKKSVHSVAVIGAPFSQGQVRAGSRHRGAGFPGSQTPEKAAVGCWGPEARRGEDGATAGARAGAFPRLGTGRTRGISPDPDEEGAREKGGMEGTLMVRGPWAARGRVSAASPESERTAAPAWGDGGEERRKRVPRRGRGRRNPPQCPVENRRRGGAESDEDPFFQIAVTGAVLSWGGRTRGAILFSFQ